MTEVLTQVESKAAELSSQAFKAFCEDISGMFGVPMQCGPGQITTETVADLEKRFGKLAAVNLVKAQGALEGTFQIVFGRKGLFILAGLITMPEQMTSLLEKCVVPAQIQQNIKSGTTKEAQAVSDSLSEAGNLLVGSWDRIFREQLEGHKHFVQSDVFIGEPWDNPEEKLGLTRDEKFTLVCVEITVTHYPPFTCGAVFPDAVFGKTKNDENVKTEAEAEEKTEADAQAQAEAEAKAKVEAEEKAKAEAEVEAEAKNEDEEETKDEPQAEAKGEGEEKAKDEPQAEAKDEGEEKTESEGEEETKDEPQAEAKDESEEKTESEGEEKAKDEPQAEAKDEGEEKAKDEPQAEAKDESEEKTESEEEAKDEPQAEAKDEGEEKTEIEIESQAETEEKAEAESKEEDSDQADAEEVKDTAKEEAAATDESREPTSGQVSEAIQKMADSVTVLPDQAVSISLATPASSIMRKDVVWSSPNDSVQQALTKMQQQDAGYLMVGTDGALEGIVSNSNITGAISPYLRPVFTKWRRPLDDASLNIRIKWVMSRPVRVIKPQTPLGAIMENMAQSGSRCLPVADEQNKILGLVTVFDIFELLNRNANVSSAGKVAQAPPLVQK
jgi:CBS domain-containing protein